MKLRYSPHVGLQTAAQRVMLERRIELDVLPGVARKLSVLELHPKASLDVCEAMTAPVR